ncbi:hypothetical protein Q5762_39225, partial [Streptomyces sp. P9(2023)]|uniref:hypothetical protein n=1 Tax=Streptomyces sp. P9(2023) TaxID=3064394 RepID=UPI0028F44575
TPMLKPFTACSSDTAFRLISGHIYLGILATPNWLSLSDLHLVQRNLGSRPIMIVCVPNLRNISRISIFP